MGNSQLPTGTRVFVRAHLSVSMQPREHSHTHTPNAEVEVDEQPDAEVEEQPLSLPLSLPTTLFSPVFLSKSLFTSTEEEQQHVGQIRATGRLRARVFS